MFAGSMVALVTPMTADSKIDLTKLYELLDWHIAAGTDSILLFGTTGESPTITDAERAHIIPVVVEHLAGRVPLIVGTGTNDTAHSITLTQQAMAAGADACLLVTPYYNKPTQQGMIEHFSAIAEAVAIPQILYNVPSRTGCDLLAETACTLSAQPNIIGIKEATGDITRLETLQKAQQPFYCWSGDDSSSLDFIASGGHGVISVIANITPDLVHAMASAALDGDISKATAISKQLNSLNQALGLESNPIPCKWLLSKMGRIGPEIRLPLTGLAACYQQPLLAAAKEAGIVIEA